MSCTPRIQPLPAIEIMIAGAARMAILNQDSAAPATSCPGPAIAETTGPAASSTATMANSPKPSDSQVACTPSPTAAGRSPPPYSRADRAVVP